MASASSECMRWILLEKVVGRKQQTFSWCPVSVAAVRAALCGCGAVESLFGAIAKIFRRQPRTHKRTAPPPPHRTRIIGEANKLLRGIWVTKTTRLGTVLATRQGTLESVWL